MAPVNPSAAPVETKIVASTFYGAASTFIAWVLLAGFHVALPSSLSMLLPGALGVAVGGAAGWMAKHTPRLEEVVAQVASVVAAQQAITGAPLVQSPAAAVPAGQAGAAQ